MIKPDMIPDEVVKVFEEEFYFGEGDWKRNTIAAALNAWPGVKENKVQVPDDSDEIRYTLKTTGIILPLPQENTNAET